MVSERDRQLGALVHLAAIPFPYVGPLVVGLIGRASPFIRYQATKALIEQVVASIVIGTLIVISIAISIYQLVQTGFDLSKIDWVGVIIKSLAVWAMIGLFNLWNLINAIRDLITAWRGELPNRPKWTERVAQRASGVLREDPLLRQLG